MCNDIIALRNRNDSSLMRHELAYILGQMRHAVACPLLEQLLDDETEDVLVRHEVTIMCVLCAYMYVVVCGSFGCDWRRL